MDVINNTNHDDLDTIVAGVAMQIALFDVLKAIEITPSCTFGVRYGEFANAYANGSFSMEHTILAAYHVGKLLLSLQGSKNHVQVTKYSFE